MTHVNAKIHPQAIVEDNATIGAFTKIWAFAHILPGAIIGEHCNICDMVFIENNVRIGNKVTIKSGVQLWDGITVEDDVFIGPNATFTNDPFPRSKKHLNEHPQTIIKEGASIGANATILPGVVIGSKAMVGAGAVVTKNVPPRAIVAGNPARILGYADTNFVDIENPAPAGHLASEISISGASLVELPEISDLRGDLSFAELRQGLPFEPKRYFLVYNVPTREIRGEHAHRNLHQFLICVHGSVSVVVDDGMERQEVKLGSPKYGLHIAPMVWSIQYRYSDDAVLLVLASDIYRAEDYIRDYTEFLELRDTSRSKL